MAEILEIAGKVTADGMPVGNAVQLPIQGHQVTVTENGTAEPALDDDAAAVVLWDDYQRAAAFLDNNSWLLEWQYIDYLYQSPNYDRDLRTSGGRPARISRFNVAKNSRTMSCQTRRALFADTRWFMLEPQGKLAGLPDAELYLKAWTEILTILSDRADLDYNMRLFIECQSLQGTAIAIPLWEERKVVRKHRSPTQPPQEIDLGNGVKKKVHTFKSDDWKLKEETVMESWPCFEYRRLGTTLYSEKWRHPGRPDLSGWPRIDIDYVDFQNLQQMRQLDCYKGIPDDENLIRYFIWGPQGDAPIGTDLARSMSNDSSSVFHAAGENVHASKNPFKKPLMKLAYWTEDTVVEMLCYEGRRKIIRNDKHNMESHAAGYSANWLNVDNAGYGFGIGRMNAGDQRMSAGVLNEVLKYIAFPLNAPILYDNSSGNAPAQTVIAGLGTFLGVDPGKSGDVQKAFKFLEMPQIPADAWKIYQLAVQGGEQLVGADAAMMQGQLPGPGSSVGRTAAGVNRLASKADENIADPVEAIEQVLQRWLMFLWKMVCEQMPVSEIRQILSDKFGDAILDQIDAQVFMDARFNVKILAGQKLAARAAIAQLIPFLLQIIQQPNLLQYLHQIGLTVNFKEITDLFMRMSELAEREDIFIPLSDDQKKTMAQMQPGVQKMQTDLAVEQERGKNEMAKTAAEGKQKLTEKVVDAALEHVAGSIPLEMAEGRMARANDTAILRNGVI